MSKDNNIMGSLIGVGVVGAVGYYLYSNWDSIFGPAPAQVGTKTGTTGTPKPNSGNPMVTTQIVPNPPPITNSGGLMSLMRQYVATDTGFFIHAPGVATYDEWNWVRGKYQANPENQSQVFPGDPVGKLYTLDDFITGIMSKGVSLNGVKKSGLGLILDMGDFFSSTPHQKTVRGNFR